MTASERAAGELVADVDTLTGFIARRIDNDGTDPRELAEALVAAGFGRVVAARREERERIARAIEARRPHIHDEPEGDCADGCGWLDFAARIARTVGTS